MSDQPGMSHEEYIAALRKDLEDSAAEAREKHAQDTQAREAAEAEVARLEKAAADASEPDAQIRAGLMAIRKRFQSLFS